MSEAEKYKATLFESFAKILKAEDVEREAKKIKQEAESTVRRMLAEAETAKETAWHKIEELMAEQGVVEELLEGKANDYKIAWQKGRETVEIHSADAVPDEFVKVERKPMKKEIQEHMNHLRESGGELPNWASFKPASSKLGWKTVKKS